MKELWDRISPGARKWIYLAGVGVVIVLLVLVVGPSDRVILNREAPVTQHLLTDEDAGKVTALTLNAKIDATTAENQKLQRQMDAIRADIRKLSEGTGPSRTYLKQVGELSAKLKTLERNNVGLRTELEQLRESGRSGGSVFLGGESGERGGHPGAGTPGLPFAPATARMPEVVPNDLAADRTGQSGPGGMSARDAGGLSEQTKASEPLGFSNDAEEFYRNAPVPRVTTDTHPTVGAPGARQTAPRRTLTPRSIHEGSDGASVNREANRVLAVRRAAEARSTGQLETEELVLPTGSIIEAVVLAGLDAPTNQGAKRDPFPALLRFKKEAILPNRYRADVRECFLVASGYGDQSTERVFLRGETLSCGFEGGVFSEASMDSYAQGEDGKAGVRGRLVTKDGALLRRAALAGFAQGMSKAFDINVVPVVNTADDVADTANVQSLDAQDAIRTGAIGGVSKAFEKLADRYLELADSIFPVIELDAGRTVTFIVTRPIRLKVPKKA